MEQNKTTEENVRYAIESSCIPLLCGRKKAVRKTARALYRAFGIVSYALFTEKTRPLDTLLAPLCLRIVPAPPPVPALLSDTAIRFFEGLDQSALPVFLDCTEDAVFLNTPALRARLESRCFLSDAAHREKIPPFCYLSEDGTKERSDPT